MNDENDQLTLSYDLHSLPTAQHKAGLAGLLIMIESMKMRNIQPLPEVRDVTATTVELVVKPEALQAVFDDLYAAQTVEIESQSKWSGSPPKRIEERETAAENGEVKRKKIYVYDVTQPSGAFLAACYPDGDGLWLKLWRSMMWGILRDRSTTRGVYEERLTGGRSSQARLAYDSVAQSFRVAAKKRVMTKSLASPLYIGAQDSNAERVPFQGVPQHNLLLHFWPLVSLIFIPVEISTTGETKERGYVIAIPEPSNIEYFVGDGIEMLRSLDATPRGFRPKAAFIDLPEEGGLEYLHHLALHRVEQHDICIASVEVYHLEKQGNSVRTHAAERIEVNRSILDAYESVRGSFFNPIFKAIRLRNMLAGRPWYAGMDAAFSSYPSELFVYTTGKSSRFSFFGDDARRTFRSISQNLQSRKEQKDE